MNSLYIWFLFVVIPHMGLVFWGAFVVLACVFFLMMLGHDDIAAPISPSTLGFVGTVTISFLLIAGIIPNKQEMAVIISVPYLSQLKGAENIPNNLVKKINDILQIKLEKGN